MHCVHITAPTITIIIIVSLMTAPMGAERGWRSRGLHICRADDSYNVNSDVRPCVSPEGRLRPNRQRSGKGESGCGKSAWPAECRADRRARQECGTTLSEGGARARTALQGLSPGQLAGTSERHTVLLTAACVSSQKASTQLSTGVI